MENTVNVRERNYIERIRSQYQLKEETKLDELKRLNKKAKSGAKLFSYIFGTIGSLILGVGMCIGMQVILSNLMPLGIIIGILGIIIVSVNYFIYKKLLIKGKEKYSKRILELSKELLNEEN